MLSESSYFGGAKLVTGSTTSTLPSRGARFLRVVQGPFGPGTTTLTLPPAGRFGEGGPIYIISNSSGGNVRIKRDGGVTIGTTSDGSTGYVFLLDATANGGAGEWSLAGSGSAGSTGDQDAPTGFQYGTGPTPRGLARDLGAAAESSFPDLPADSPDMDFGGATVPAAPPGLQF